MIFTTIQCNDDDFATPTTMTTTTLNNDISVSRVVIDHKNRTVNGINLHLGKSRRYYKKGNMTKRARTQIVLHVPERNTYNCMCDRVEDIANKRFLVMGNTATSSIPGEFTSCYKRKVFKIKDKSRFEIKEN